MFLFTYFIAYILRKILISNLYECPYKKSWILRLPKVWYSKMSIGKCWFLPVTVTHFLKINVIKTLKGMQKVFFFHIIVSYTYKITGNTKKKIAFLFFSRKFNTFFVLYVSYILNVLNEHGSVMKNINNFIFLWWNPLKLQI